MIKRVFTAMLAASMLSGCYAHRYSVAQPDVSMSDERTGPVKKHFKVHERSWTLFSGLVAIIDPNLDDVIKREAVGHPVKNLKITDEMTPADFALTYGLMAAGVTAVSTIYPARPDLIYQSAIGAILAFPQFRTVTVEGDVVKAPRKGPANDYTDEE